MKLKGIIINEIFTRKIQFMTLQSYLWGLRIGTVISFAAFCAVIFLTDPLDIGNVAFILFYLTFFLVISGLSVLVLTWLWRKMARDMLTLGEIGMAVRQGVLIGIFITVIVGMQQMKVLLWWDALIILGIVFLIELYFLTR
ncbi:MAG TPA: hypothetical protein EYG99_00910 [Candidatus Pacebacteria bacterium]|nr:hypothetical protein [Candidatus Paceibacterota bacterium]